MPASNQIVIVIGGFHRREAEIMLETALETTSANGLEVADQVWVPGAMEIPLALKRALLQESIAGGVILGVIERGETGHGWVMGQTIISAVIDLQLELMKPVGVGILGPNIRPEQIEERLVPYACDAVLAVRAMLNQSNEYS